MSEKKNFLHLLNLFEQRSSPYAERKSTFHREQQAENMRLKKVWQTRIRNELQKEMELAGYPTVDDSDDESDEEVKRIEEIQCEIHLRFQVSERLEDQPYFHGVIPRNQSVNYLKKPGDYLVRINEQHSIVLSVAWANPQYPTSLQNEHFIIQQRNNVNEKNFFDRFQDEIFIQMFGFAASNTLKPSVHELLGFYRRKKLTLRDDGLRLIRPIPRPDYLIDNDEVQLGEVLGKVKNDYFSLRFNSMKFILGKFWSSRSWRI